MAKSEKGVELTPEKRCERVKELGWVAIKLTAQRFRGAVMDFKGVGIYFTLTDCFVIKDEMGYYKAEDIKYGLYDRTVPQKDLPYVEGRKTIGWVEDERLVIYAEDTLKAIGQSAAFTEQDIDELRKQLLMRLLALNEFSEEYEVNIANVSGLASV